ncbi:hypothetical protein [Streptomyces orinoci]|uniref:glycine-rich domain-containing protein n=1 Tax=Streptomyces orinoci TaxID=67339 RepID=UPI000D64405E|nr:hypothetical protein [Streptomyces orinoci]
MGLLAPLRSWRAVLVCAAAVPLVAVPGPASAAPEPVVKAYTTGGRYEFTVPAGVTRIHVTAVGSGGGGGGGGGNNDGPLSGAGGGGGSSGAVEACTIKVDPGERIVMVVGRGGEGGAGGSGKGHNGKPRNDGHGTGVAVFPAGEGRWPRLGANVQHGRGGRGGEASGTWGSGTAGAGGHGTTGGRNLCKGSDHVRQEGSAGYRGVDGVRARRGAGGAGAASAAPPECSPAQGGPPGPRLPAGKGGEGGIGAGRDLWTNDQYPSAAGENGADGCVALTYTP